MAQKGNKGNKGKKPEILTPDKSDEQARAASQADTPSTSPPPIIDIKTKKSAAALTGLVAGMLSGALAGGAVFAALYYLNLAAETEKTAQRLQNGENRLIVLERQEERVAAALALIVESEARLSRLEEGMKAASRDMSEITVSRLDEMDAAITRLVTQLSILETDYARLGAAVQGAGDAKAMPSALLRTALLSNLSQALRAGRPYELELAAVSRQFPDYAETLTTELGPHAKTGLPQRQMIREGFIEKAPQLLADLRRREASGFWERLKADAAGVLRIRRLDAEGTDAHSVLLQIEKLMQADPPNAFPDARNLLTKLPEDIQGELAVWSAQLSAYITADTLVTDLSEQISALSLTVTSP